jgi:hypothetical protein
VFTQSIPQQVWTPEQSGPTVPQRQPPLMQNSSVSQALLQAPQWASSVLTLTSQPLAALPSQSSKPAPQAPGWQVPSTQVGGALGNEQTIPQPLQLSGSVRT